MKTRNDSIVATVACVLCLATCTEDSRPPAVESSSTRKAAHLDSAGLADNVAFDAALRAWADSAPEAVDSVRQLFALDMHTKLGRLGYAAGPFDAELTPDLREAIIRYERARSLEVTGDPLSFMLMRSLEADLADLVEQPALPIKSVYTDGDLLWANGAWVFDNMGRQSIAVTIECARTRRECIEAQAVAQPNQGRIGLSVHLQRYTIANWDPVEITTVPVDYPCIREFLRINIVQQSATKIQSKISDRDQCRNVTDGDGLITMASGVDIAGEHAATSTRARLEILRLGPKAIRALSDSASK